MKKSILLILGICAMCYQISVAQVGLNLGYKNLSVPTWNENIALGLGLTDGTKALSSGFHLGVDYWFRLKNYRIEFLPELSYNQFKFEQKDLENILHKFSSRYTSLQFHTNFYIFDFKGDCNCPTFSKQGPSLEKGVFIQLSPGISYMQNKANAEAEREATLNQVTKDGFVFNLGIGIGLDIGISDFITITPMLRYEYYLPQDWQLTNYLALATDVVLEEQSNLSQIFAGIRIGFRFDELNK